MYGVTVSYTENSDTSKAILLNQLELIPSILVKKCYLKELFSKIFFKKRTEYCSATQNMFWMRQDAI